MYMYMYMYTSRLYSLIVTNLKLIHIQSFMYTYMYGL